jgi:hypothetical protein
MLCLDLGVELLGDAEVYTSVLTRVTPSSIGPSATPAPMPNVLADVAGVLCVDWHDAKCTVSCDTKLLVRS